MTPTHPTDAVPTELHCDWYIDAEDTHPALRAFLEFKRRPAIQQIGETSPVLYARYDGEWVRVTMASRMGDVGITYNLDAEEGYKYRILVCLLEDFTDQRPGPAAATELEYLRWFFANADFGPADSDVRAYMDEAFIEETGKALPAGYEPEES